MRELYTDELKLSLGKFDTSAGTPARKDHMDHKDLCEHTRIRLIAAAIGHQQCTKTASNIVPIPGGDRVIAIGTPAQVAMMLRTQVPDRRPIVGSGGGAVLAGALSDWMTQSVVHDMPTDDQVDSEGGHHD
jgi:hypothetical protein